MLNLKKVLLFSCVWLLLVAMVVTPQPVTPELVQIVWVTQPETTYINVRDVTFERVGLAQSATGGVTNTVTISGTEGMVFQIQEYKLVGCCLELITFFNTSAVPHVDFPTATPILPPTQTQQPTNTPIATPVPIQLQHKLYTPMILRG
jgi:hypothetical protein